MSGFQRKLRRFKRAWMAQPERASWAARSVVGFLFNADDTPRFWADQGPYPEPVAEPPADFPRFRSLAESLPARHAA